MGLPCLSDGLPPIRYAPAKGRQKMVRYSGEGPKRDFPINTLGSRLPFGCRGRTWCQLYGGRWRMPGSILCYRQFSAAAELALGPVPTMSRPLWGTQSNCSGSSKSIRARELNPHCWWSHGRLCGATPCIDPGLTGRTAGVYPRLGRCQGPGGNTGSESPTMVGSGSWAGPRTQ